MNTPIEIPNKLKWITIPMHLSAVAYLFVMVLFISLFSYGMHDAHLDEDFLFIFNLIIVLVCLSLIVLIEIIIVYLKKGKKWAWIAAICFCFLYIPSIYLPFGIFMIIGLIDRDVREFCGVN
jgi:hypothetical protein